MYQDLIILMTLFFSVLWLIKKHYDNAYNIRNMQIRAKNLKFKSSNYNKEAKKDIANIRAELIDYHKSMRKMQDDIIEGKQNDINIDAKYKLKLEVIDGMLEKYAMPIPNNVDDDLGVAFDPMKDRTSAEKAAYDKLTKQIIGRL